MTFIHLLLLTIFCHVLCRTSCEVTNSSFTGAKDLSASSDSKENLSKSSKPIQSQAGIRWRNLAVTVPRKRDDSTRSGHNANTSTMHFLLHPSNGFVRNGSLCGIIGPSGAGKSTFLAALSGTTLRNHGKKVFGSVWIEMQQSGQIKFGTDIRKKTMNEEVALIEASNQYCSDTSKSLLSISKGEVAILNQHDVFFSMLTAKETIDLAAYLQLANSSYKDRTILVHRIMESLGLAHIQNRRIGNDLFRPSESSTSGFFSDSGSLSGGERRRLAVALELVTDPKVFFADEPTTGLDSGQAQKVVGLMKQVAINQDIPCICTLHQPRASIWKMLDSFILLAPGGRMIYMGDKENAVPYFASLGFDCPPETNPAEFFIDLITVDTEDAVQATVDKGRIDFLTKAFSHHNDQLLSMGPSHCWIPPKWRRRSDNGITHPPFLLRFLALFRRSIRQNVRDLKINLLRLTASIGLAGLFSELFKSVRSGSVAQSVADRVALLSYGVINMTMMSLTKTLNLFGKEKPVVIREQMRQQYSSFDYLISKAFAELPLDIIFSTVFAAALKYVTNLRTPIHLLSGTFSLLTVASASLGFAVGSLTSSVEEAMTLGMPIMVILMAVGVINPSGVVKTKENPVIFFLRKCSPIRLAIEALCLCEFRGMQFSTEGKKWRFLDLPRMGALAAVRNGDDVLDALGLRDSNFLHLMKSLSILSGINILVSLFGLSFCGPTHVVATGDTFMKINNSTITVTQSTEQFQPLKVPLLK